MVDFAGLVTIITVHNVVIKIQANIIVILL